jgi:hypothetical protein
VNLGATAAYNRLGGLGLIKVTPKTRMTQNSSIPEEPRSERIGRLIKIIVVSQ